MVVLAPIISANIASKTKSSGLELGEEHKSLIKSPLEHPTRL
tara:strand:+ start:381 stop:506 length:126 start_codon:yes stop_codon:yes gene_type:complete